MHDELSWHGYTPAAVGFLEDRKRKSELVRGYHSRITTVGEHWSPEDKRWNVYFESSRGQHMATLTGTFIRKGYACTGGLLRCLPSWKCAKTGVISCLMLQKV